MERGGADLSPLGLDKAVENYWRKFLGPHRHWFCSGSPWVAEKMGKVQWRQNGHNTRLFRFPSSRMDAASTPEFFTAKLDPSGQQCDAWTNQPLLYSLEAGSIPWPSSCRNGTCRTCLGQLKSGRVRYEIEWPGLTTEEMEAGCVLPCVAYPQSDVVLQDPEN